ncbi:hypothetical protein CFOL_v3_11563 [Cephalotus follicularis]|uniref:Exo_endo_phos domain-containing protein n=1 Tax=Cephalotus follicularis TaxID=3775 RepID=A0A1Q3BJ56_CEPFO|nr:hypothetical protein CFOL_v3_11563 [Cephalotus follicularis]
MGDFHEIISIDEKEGGNRRSSRQMENFRDTLDMCRLRDLDYRGCKFTWSNGRLGVNQIRSRLDKCVSRAERMSLFPMASVSYDSSGTSDHCPVLLSLMLATIIREEREFTRFEAMWVRDKKCAEIIKGAWCDDDTRDGTCKVFNRIRNCRERFSTWNKDIVGCLSRRIKDKKNGYSEVQRPEAI